MPISANILGHSVTDRAKLVDWFTLARPPWAVVMDELDIALRVRMASPGTKVIFRRYRPDDHKLHEVMTPDAFLNSVGDVPAPYWTAAGNEPGGDQRAMAEWYADLIRLADARGRKLAVWNVSTGNPSREMVEAGVYDAMFRALAASATGHVLATHEYWKDDPVQEPFHVGRTEAILRRFSVLGLKRPEWVVTEAGRDLAGGRDGWRAAGLTEAQYADKLAAALNIYGPDVTACVFCWGHGDGRWDSYDIQNAPELLSRMAAMNTQEADVVPGYQRLRTVNNANVRLRAAPGLSAATLDVLKPGVWVKPLGAPTAKDGYRWQPVAVDVDATTHKHGFIALEVLDIGG